MPTSRRKQWTFFSILVFVVIVAFSMIYEDREKLQGVVSPSLSPTLTPLPSAVPSPILGATTSALLEEGVVKRVIDGDTIQLSDGRTVRYIGIDTPETKHPTLGVQCFGAEATQRNTELVMNKPVRLEKDVNETDRYGRLLRYVWVDQTFINQQLVVEGYAFARSYPPDIAKQDILRQAEATAREGQKGLWGSCPLNE